MSSYEYVVSEQRTIPFENVSYSGSSGATEIVYSGGYSSSGNAGYSSSSAGGFGGSSIVVSGGGFGGSSAVSGGFSSASGAASGSSGAILYGSSGSAVSAGNASQAVANQVVNDLLTINQVNQVRGGGQVVLEASAYSQIEQAILRANIPIDINESDVITVNGETGIWSNKAEVINWRGVLPIQEYLINQDASPEVIRKRTEQLLTYEQEIAIRYLRPPTPPPPGEILIKQEKNIPTPPAPPLVIRQVPPRPETPAPLVIREAPPRPPVAIGQKMVTISGKRLPPPPRKVVIERLPPLPSKPQAIFIERWLPYSQQKRKVIFARNTVPDPVIATPRNVIIQWESPAVQIRKEFRDLGVVRANPAEYVARYGASLKASIELPQFVREIRAPVGVVLAADYVAPSSFDLEGDIQALNLINLDAEGLSEYRRYLAYSSSFSGAASASAISSASAAASASASGYVSLTVNPVIAELFSSIDVDASGKISRSEADALLLKLNSRLGRSYGENDANAFFRAIDINRDGLIDFAEFKNVIIKQFI